MDGVQGKKLGDRSNATYREVTMGVRVEEIPGFSQGK